MMRTAIDPVRRTLVMLGAVLLLPAGLSAQTVGTEHEAHRLHGNPEAMRAALDDPARDGWQKPHEVIEALGLKPGDRVADIGAGTGYFALRFAHHVGPTGHVYAVDVSRDMLATVSERAQKAGLSNVTTVEAGADDPGLDAPVNVIFICDTWHHINHRTAYATRLKQSLAPGGRVVIVDFHKRDIPVGPPASMKLSRDEVIAELRAAGFELTREHTFLPYQYALEFTAR